MASLGEMMQYADYSSKVNNPLPIALEHGVSGFVQGLEARKKAQNAKLDMQLKLLDIAEKTQKIANDQAQAKMDETIGKAFGAIPMGVDEHNAAVETMRQNLGITGPNLPNTQEGKIAGMANGMKKWGATIKMGKNATFRSYDPDAPSSSGGSGRGGGNSVADERLKFDIERSDRDMATKLANREAYNKRVAGMDSFAARRVDPNTVTADPADILKFVPIAKAIREQDKDEYFKLTGNVLGEQEMETMLPGDLGFHRLYDMQQRAINARPAPNESRSPLKEFDDNEE